MNIHKINQVALSCGNLASERAMLSPLMIGLILLANNTNIPSQSSIYREPGIKNTSISTYHKDH